MSVTEEHQTQTDKIEFAAGGLVWTSDAAKRVLLSYTGRNTAIGRCQRDGPRPARVSMPRPFARRWKRRGIRHSFLAWRGLTLT